MTITGNVVVERDPKGRLRVLIDGARISGLIAASIESNRAASVLTIKVDGRFFTVREAASEFHE
jgi:hypothetical protein